MFGFACLLITLIFIGAVLAHKLVFSFALSALSGVPRWMLYSRRRSRGTQMFRNMMRRKGTSYPGQRRDDGGEEAQEHVADDIEEAPPKPPVVENSSKGVGHEVNMLDDYRGEGGGTTYLRNGDETPLPTEPLTFQARFRFTIPNREMDGDNTAPNMESRANEQTEKRLPSAWEDQSQTTPQPREEPAFGVRDKHEPGYSQLSQNERLSFSPGFFKEPEPGVWTLKEQGSGNQETTVKPNHEEKVPPHREDTVSARRENDKQSGDGPSVSSNGTRGQTSVVPPQPRVRVPTEKKPEDIEEPEFNDERTPPPADDS